MIYVVFDMHKSGTTMLTTVRHEPAIPMEQNFPAGVEYNKAKHEARWAQEVKDQILDPPAAVHAPNILRKSEFEQPPRPQPSFSECITYFPHSLYLFILCTVRVIGILPYIYWLIANWRHLSLDRKRNSFQCGVEIDLPTLCIGMFVIFLVDQLKVKFLRSNLLDYQHYIATLSGLRNIRSCNQAFREPYRQVLLLRNPSNGSRNHNVKD